MKRGSFVTRLAALPSLAEPVQTIIVSRASSLFWCIDVFMVVIALVGVHDSTYPVGGSAARVLWQGDL